ncbi:MAG: ATP-dependent Clp protease ATP-binding subunit ClpC [Solirubrobacteraceae bacterium]|jgi:ATP-dependent Clp protease ATP-binding subunit ClpA|nr:ATP-dependent Clp protease ATP-binding subunit ClpC [Solirubrobacteraceae bacterium]
MFEHFDERARLCVVRTQEEAIRLGRAEIGAEHLLLGIAAVDDGLVGVEVERLRAAVVALHGVGAGTKDGWTQFSPEAQAALEGANQQALALGHTTIDPAHLLLAVLDADGAARRVLRESEATVAEVRERALAAAGRPVPADGGQAPPADPLRAAPTDHAQQLRDGRPVAVMLLPGPYPIGDLGHPAVDARLLELMLVNDSRAARLLRDHGIDEAAVRAALGPAPPP